jgi:ribA/ribD-fused uncharacterized protein
MKLIAEFGKYTDATAVLTGWRYYSRCKDCKPGVQLMDDASKTTGYVGFYEREFYPLSNFSAFTLMWEISPREGLQRFDTSEAVYHWEKFRGNIPTADQRAIQAAIRSAPSAHEAFKIAERNRQHRRPKWDDEKADVMLRIIRAKADQHEYVRRKLLETGDRDLIEDSWRDDFWGWGPNNDGQNMLGKLWMVIRQECRK